MDNIRKCEDCKYFFEDRSEGYCECTKANEIEISDEELEVYGQTVECPYFDEYTDIDYVPPYLDRNGNELHEGDFVKYSDGRIKKLYLTEDGQLGTDATNPKWIERGIACECEYGIYPLDYEDLQNIEKVTGE